MLTCYAKNNLRTPSPYRAAKILWQIRIDCDCPLLYDVTFLQKGRKDNKGCESFGSVMLWFARQL